MKNFFLKALRDVFAGIELLLVVRVFLKLFAASRAAPLVDVWYQLTDLLMSPVRFIFPTPQIVGQSTFDLVAIAAMIFYAILFFALLRVIRLVAGDTRTSY